MATVYILYSKSINAFYTGSCIDFELRFSQHLNKTFSTSFTAKADDWSIFLKIENLEYQQARGKTEERDFLSRPSVFILF
jgi:putative endonuclease